MRDDFNIESTFNSLLRKKYQSSFIDYQGLNYFFKRNGFYATEEDILAIIKRIDLNYDDALSLDELSKCVLSFMDSSILTSYNEATSSIYKTRNSEAHSTLLSPNRKTS